MGALRETDNSSLIEKSSNLPIIILGIVGMFTISSVAILHTNVKEFIQVIYFSVSTIQISLYDTILYIAYLVVGILTGILSDRIGKRKMFIVIGSIGSALFSGLLTISPTYSVLLVFRFLQGSFTVLAWQTFMTITLDISTSKNRGKNMGIFGTFLAISMGLSPVIGGFLADRGVFIPYYVAVGFNSLVIILAIVVLKEPSKIKKNPSLIKSISSVKDTPEILIPSTFNFIDRFHMGFILFALPLLILEKLNLGPSMRGIAMGIFALPFILLQYPMGRLSDKIGRYKLLIIGSVGYGVVLSMIGLFGTNNYTILVIGLFFLGVLSGITAPPNMALIGDYVGKENRAIGMGVFNFTGNIGIVLGPIVGGVLVSSLNYIYAFIIMGIIELGGIVVFIIFLLLKKYGKAGIMNKESRSLTPKEIDQNVLYVDSTRQHER